MARAPPVAAAGLEAERDGRAVGNNTSVERGRALDWTRLVLRRRRRRRHQSLQSPGPLQRPAKDRARVHSTRIEPAEVAQQVCIGREQGGEALRRRLAQLREERIIGAWRGRVVGGAALFRLGAAALGLGLAGQREAVLCQGEGGAVDLRLALLDGRLEDGDLGAPSQNEERDLARLRSCSEQVRLRCAYDEMVCFDPSQNTFFQAQFPRHFECIFTCNLLHIINNIKIQILRHKSGTNSLDLMRARLNLFAISCLRYDWTLSRFNGNGFHFGISLLDNF